MQTSTHRPATARRPAVSRLPHPGSLVPDNLSWLAHYFRDSNRAQALEDQHTKFCGSRRVDPVLREATWHGANSLTIEAKKSLKYAIEEGMLLFAWQGTTVFELAGVPA